MDSRKEVLRQKRLCRLCLTNKNPLSGIYDKTKNKRHAAVSLSLQIMNCFCIEVVPSDGRPSLICDMCRYFVEQFYAFKQMCREADELLMGFLEGGDKIQPIEWPLHLLQAYKSFHKITEKSKEEVPKAKEPSVIDEAVKIECKSCKIVFSYGEELEYHNIVSHNPSLECSKCKRLFKSKRNLTEHVKLHFQFNTCPTCNTKFQSPSLLIQHVKVAHTKVPIYKCSECAFEVLDMKKMARHTKLHKKHKQRTLKCPYCLQRCTNRSKLDEHLEKNHAEEEPFRCEVCVNTGSLMKFSTFELLKNHLAGHTTCNLHKCKYCPKVYTQLMQYNRHLRFEHKLKKVRSMGKSAFKCTICHRVFEKQSELTYHTALHSTSNLQCPLCKESFEDIDAVTLHLKTHVEGEQYMCDLCELVFTSEWKLEQHFSVDHKDQINEENSQDAALEQSQFKIMENGDLVMVEPDARKSDQEQQSVDGASKPIVSEPCILKKAEANALKMKQNKENALKRKTGEEANDKASKPKVVKMSLPDLSSDETEVAAVATAPLKPAEKSLRLLEKDLHELSRASKAKKASGDSEEDRAQFTTSTPKTTLPKKKQPKVAAAAPEKLPAEKAKPKEKTVEKSNPSAAIPKTRGRLPRASSQKFYSRTLSNVDYTNSSTEDEEEYTVSTSMRRKKSDTPVASKRKMETPAAAATSTSDAGLTPGQAKRNKGRPRKSNTAAKSLTSQQDKPSLDQEKSNLDQDKARSQQEKSNADVNKPKADLEKLKAHQEKSKADQEKPKADQDKSKADQDKPKADQDKSKANPIKPKGGQDRPVTKAAIILNDVMAQSKSMDIPILECNDGQNQLDVEPDKTTTVPRQLGGRLNKLVADEVTANNSSNNVTPVEPSSNKAKTGPAAVKSPQAVITKNIFLSPTKPSDVITTAEGQKLIKIPSSMIKTLPQSVQGHVPANRGQICSMKIGEKTVKVQKIVMSKAEVAAMTKKGLLEMKDGTMVLKQGIRLPAGAQPQKLGVMRNAVTTGTAKSIIVSPRKPIDPPKPTRCPTPPIDL